MTMHYGDAVRLRRGPRVPIGQQWRVFFAYAGNGNVVVFGGEQFPPDEVIACVPLAKAGDPRSEQKTDETP